MQMIRVLIVDDETLSRQTLKELLVRHCGHDVEVVAMAASVAEARWAVEEHEPDVVFLDVEMPKENGFDFLRSLPERNFAVIFVTAYDHYALRAIKASATDYLLKPIDIDELRQAIDKLLTTRNSRDLQERNNSINTSRVSSATILAVVPLPS